jgi:hypothetical protein
MKKNRFEIGQATESGFIKGFYLDQESFRYIFDDHKEVEEEEIKPLNSQQEFPQPKYNLGDKTNEGIIGGILFEDGYLYTFYSDFYLEETTWIAEELLRPA